MCNNYLKTITKRPSIYLERTASFGDEVAAKQVEEYWFFDDTDAASTSAALTKAKAFRDRQPMGVRMQVSIYRPISAAQEIRQVGQPSYADGKMRAA